MRQLLLLSLLLCAPLPVELGCGECVFDEDVTATVLGEDAAPLEGVTARTCFGERCDVGSDDDDCVEAITDAEGRFTLKVQMCRPSSGSCALRPIIFEKDGYQQLTQQPVRTGEQEDFVLERE